MKLGNVAMSVILGVGIAALFYMVWKSMGVSVVDVGYSNNVDKNIQEYTTCTSRYPPYQGDIRPPRCDSIFDTSPVKDYYEARLQWNCGDERHHREPGCYHFNPMDSIFRSPSDQITYSYR